MQKVISIGKQNFAQIREQKYFYIDKTEFICEWWESGDDVTLITRPRRFGKTLNMDMLKCFFSNQYAGRSDLFEGLSVWKKEKYQKLQGTYPVIFMTFADVKADCYEECKNSIIACINEVYQSHRYLLESTLLTDGERELFRVLDEYVNNPEPEKRIASELIFRSIKGLSSCLERYYGKKVILLLDEYDTPMQEAYVHGYWNEFTTFMRSFFNSTFKTNPAMERAMMTGKIKDTSSLLGSKIPRQVSEMDLITRFKKTSPSNQCQESIFSDLNNLTVITTTSERYEDCFGFTEEEVFQSLEAFGMSEKKQITKTWYDGFTFGRKKDIYNPWSITNFLKEKQLRPYWALTSSNALINKLIQKSAPEIKEMMEELLNHREIVVSLDEQIIFDQLERNKNAIWSLMLASGYLKVQEVEYKGALLTPWYHLCITNLETMSMFYTMFHGWFDNEASNYNEFVKALLDGNIKEMNVYMNDVALTTFSSFDTGNHPSKKTQPERFYHGFVLGLLVELRERYIVKSNRESGYGRYDVMLIPQQKEDDAIVLEFKVFNAEEEESLRDTVQSALQQIEDKKYDTELITSGIKKEKIRHYGFAFEGKKVLIG